MEQKLQALKDKVKNLFSSLWNSNKLYFYLIGTVLIIIKFRELLINMLVSSSKVIFSSSQKKDDLLSSQEKTDNKEADRLVEEASKLPSEEKPVDENWYKKD